jgi:hypothetical protein
MSIAVVQSPAPQSQTVQNPSQAFGSNVAAGNLLILLIDWGALAGTISVSDTADSVPWTQIDNLSAQSRSEYVFAKVVRTSAACTVNISTDLSRTYGWSLYEFSGVTINLDGAATHNNGGATTAPLTATLATTFATDLVLTVLRGGSVSVDPSSPWVSEHNGGHGTAYQIRSATGNVSAAWTTSSSAYIDTILAFRSGFSINLSGVASSEADGTPSVSAKDSINLSGIGTTEADGTPSVTPGSVIVALIGKGSSELDGTPGVVPGAVTIALAGLSSTEQDGSPSVTPGTVQIALIGIGTAERDGAPSVTSGPVSIALIGLGSSEGDGVPSVRAGAVSVVLIGLGSTEADGRPSVALGLALIYLIGLSSNEADGTPRVSLALVATAYIIDLTPVAITVDLSPTGSLSDLTITGQLQTE